MHNTSQSSIAVLGAGEIAAGFVYGLLLSGVEAEVTLVDRQRTHAEELALELQQALIFSTTREIRAGTAAEAANADLVVLCGAKSENGGSPESIAVETLRLVQDFATVIPARKSSPIMLVGATPVDLLTYAARNMTGLPRNQVLGIGTTQASATLRYLLGRHFRVDPASVHAYILGGDGGEVPIWSSASIAGMSVREVCKAHGCPETVLQSLFRQVQERVRPLSGGCISHISRAAALVRLATAVLRNENHIFTVSTVLKNEYGVRNSAFSVPAVIGEKGIDRILHVELSDEEVAELLACGRRTEEAIRKLSLPEYHGTAT